jgi:hypothetical protein
LAILTDVGPNDTCGPTRTVLVAAKAGTARAAHSAATASRTMSLFMVSAGLLAGMTNVVRWDYGHAAPCLHHRRRATQKTGVSR